MNDHYSYSLDQRNRAGLGVTSGKIPDQSAVWGCGFDSGTREARVTGGALWAEPARCNKLRVG